MKAAEAKRSPAATAFAVAQRMAATSAAVGLREAALDITSDTVAGIDATHAALIKAYEANDVSSDEVEHRGRDEAGYVYGLAVGLALGKGGAH